MSTGKVFYAKQDHLYILKFVGDIRYTMGHSLDNFLDQLFAQMDFDDVLIDLTEATSIDSTALGLLAKIANLMRTHSDKKVTIASGNEDIDQILASVGFYQVFSIRDDHPGFRMEAVRQLLISDSSKAGMAKTLFEAHSILSELNDNNRKVFETVVDVFKDKLETKK